MRRGGKVPWWQGKGVFASRTGWAREEQGHRDAGGKHSRVSLRRLSSWSDGDTIVRDRSMRGTNLQKFTCHNQKLKLWVKSSQLLATH